jgi:hypothetical protein
VRISIVLRFHLADELNEFRRLTDAVEQSLGFLHQALHTIGIAANLIGHDFVVPSFVPGSSTGRNMCSSTEAIKRKGRRGSCRYGLTVSKYSSNTRARSAPYSRQCALDVGCFSPSIQLQLNSCTAASI